MSAAIYENAVRMFTLGGLDWEHDSIKVLLADDRYVPDQGADQSRADLSLGEVVPSGSYRSGGAPLLDRDVVMSRNELRLTAGSVGWTGFTGSYRYAVVYRAGDGADRSSDSLVAYTDLGRQDVTNASITVDFAEAGVCVFTIGAAA